MAKCIKISIAGPHYARYVQEQIQADFMKGFWLNLDFEPMFVFESCLAMRNEKSLVGKHVIATVQFSAPQAALMNTEMADSVCSRLNSVLQKNDPDSKIVCDYVVAGANHLKFSAVQAA